jgi:hypothetical protein
MLSTNGHGLKRSVLWAILYARVSTDEQARSGGVSKYENAAASLPRSHRRRRRRAVGISESVVSPEGAFAEWHGYARIDAQLHKYGGQVPRLTEPG